MSLLDFDALTFDCYGTLIDWEAGILAAVEAHLPGVDRPADEILETFARFETEEEATDPKALYPEILKSVHRRLANVWRLETTPEQASAFGRSVAHWPAFPDSSEALQILGRHYKLVVLSNIDRRSFAFSQEKLGATFDHVFTAEDIGSYKPDPRNFEFLLDALAQQGIQKNRILHTAQSLFHDHVPAQQFGLATCWIDRRHNRPGWGATMPPPEAVETDFRFSSLGAMAKAVEDAAG